MLINTYRTMALMNYVNKIISIQRNYNYILDKMEV